MFDTNYPEDITIEEGVSLAARCMIIAHFVEIDDDTHYHYSRGKVVIKKNAYIGCNTVICKAVVIGENAVIGVNSVVNKPVPENAVVAGIPAKILRITPPRNIN